jgi:hypothetical protein
LPSSQFFCAPEQAPFEHLSYEVQELPSLQLEVLFVNLQPELGLHESVVQGLLSLHVSALPPLQLPHEHLSFVVQALPSLHGAVLSVCLHLPETNASSVQGLPSSQLTDEPLHTPAEH